MRRPPPIRRADGDFENGSKRRSKTSLLLTTTLLIGVVALIGCDDDPEDDRGPSEQLEQQQQRERQPEPISKMFRDVDCAGSQNGGDDHRYLRGVVVAPVDDFKEGDESDFTDQDETLAESGARGESPVAGATVGLSRFDDRGEPVGSPLVETTTDERGRWCIRTADTAGPELTAMVWAKFGTDRLRRPSTGDDPMYLQARHEALMRFLVDEGHRLTELEVDDYQRLDRQVRDAVDAVRARPGAGLDSLVNRLRETIESDPVVTETSQRLYRKDSTRN